MPPFYKLRHSGYGTDRELYEIPQHTKVRFEPIGVFLGHSDIISEVFDFSYRMSFGAVGAHRPYRTGGTENRHNGQIFVNAFQGKLAEFALYEQLNNHYRVTYPDTRTYRRGIWDITDLTVQGIDVSVKSTTHKGNLLLLETGDWDNRGVYLPNNKQYPFHFLIRISPDLKKIFKQHHLLYSDNCERETVEALILNNDWQYDIPGFITNQELIFLINDGFKISQGSYLNRIIENNKMDAENYYVKAYDMHGLNDIFDLLPV